ncbi:3-oxoadipate enol-lactonase [Pelagibacterium sp.]|uniref:3-oxoadipate enol-lactonase n=1 Tax=Pelagibacterium sp. TaxID=1967288 RepID=UPI003A946427
MNCMQVGDVVLHYRRRAAVQGALTLVFINSLGTDFRIWDAVIDALDGNLGIVVYDKRGHGLSSLGSTPYSIVDHSEDLAGLLDALDLRAVIICGLSVGGQIAQQLYFDRPDLVSGLALCDTAAKIGEPEFWNQRIEAIAKTGLPSAAEGIMERWFTQRFRKSGEPLYALSKAMFERQPVEGYLATCAAIAGFDRRSDTSKIAVPTSVIVGAEDGATSPDLVRDFGEAIADSTFEIIQGAGHLPCIETPEQFATAIAGLVARVEKKENVR